MITQNDYLQAVKSNEAVFRAILRDLKEKRSERPGGRHIPPDLDTESPIEAIVTKYSAGARIGLFTITNFVVCFGEAEFHFKNVAPMSGGGAGLMYSVSSDGVVTFKGSIYLFMC